MIKHYRESFGDDVGFVLEECRRSNIEVKEVKMTHIQTNAWKDPTKKI